MAPETGSSPAEEVTREAPPLRGPVLTRQHWRDLTFLHWAVDPAVVAPFMPRGVRPDTFEGRTYVGLIPFRMVGLTLGPSPALPWVGTFLETNVRLYSVDDAGKRGVVFCSLDTDRALAVPAIRTLVGPPYRWARMRFERHTTPESAADGAGDLVTYEARLRRLHGPRPRSRVVVRVGAPRQATELDDFLSARWGAHVPRPPDRTTYVPNVHGAWPLRAAEVVELHDELTASVGFAGLAERPPDHVAFSDGVSTEFGLPYDAGRARRIGTASRRP